MAKGFKSNFSFGDSVAEDDYLLSTAYFDNGDYEAIKSHDDKRCFMIGRTGSGKSAALQRLKSEFPNKVLPVIPENLSFPYITNLTVVQELMDIGVHMEPFFRALWKHVLVVELLKWRFGITTPEKKMNVLTYLKEKFIRDDGKTKALAYLDAFGDKFWCETDERVKQIAETFVDKVTGSGGIDVTPGGIGLEANGEVEKSRTRTVQQEIVNRYQRIVNETQLPRLNEMIVILNNDILDSQQHFTYLVVDDLDKGWVENNSSLANMLIRCLFDTVMDLQRVKHLKVIVALRTNIFQQLNYGSTVMSGQEEKLISKTLQIRWTANDLRGLLESRAEAASTYYKIDPPKTLDEMLPTISRSGKGDKPLDYILSRTLMKPRDAITYLNACLRAAAGNEHISWSNIRDVELEYSTVRLGALRDEWKDPYFGIDKVCGCFKGKAVRMSREEITPVFDEIGYLALDGLDADYSGIVWLTDRCATILEGWDMGSEAGDWFSIYGPLVDLLYNISFIGIVNPGKTTATYSYQENESHRSHVNLSHSLYYEIHPAFRQALDIK